MTPETVVSIGREALQLALVVAAPMLLTALIVGVVVGLLQAATQVQEAALPFVIKLVALSGVLIFTGGWMLRLMIEFTRDLITRIPSLIG